MTAAWPRRRAAIPTAGGVLLAVMLAACGSAGPSSTTAQTSSAASTTSSSAATSSAATSSAFDSAGQQNANGNGSFLDNVSNGVIYIEWTNTGSGLVGTLYTDLIQQGSDGQETVDTESSGLTGTVNGSSVSLSVASGPNLNATLSGGGLVVSNYPGAQTGSVIELQMQQASTGNYDKALAAVQSEVSAANTVAQEQQSAQATAQQVQQQASAVSNDLSQLASDSQQGAANDGSALYTSSLAQERRDVGLTQHEMQHVLGEAGSTDAGTLCSDAGSVQADVGSVEADVGSVQADQGSAQVATSSIGSDLSQLRQADAALEGDRQNSAPDIPANAPSESQVQAAIASATSIDRRISGASSTALSSAQSLLATANGYQRRSDAACTAAEG
jgi:hypothetical protein